MINSKIKISIITIVYNGDKLIDYTLNSVLNQTYSNIEYIIIDGKSTDNTLSIINQYKDKISQITSEPDQGLYDAMNKGIKSATGDFLIFMNAGDEFYSHDTLEKIFSIDYWASDIYYGETLYLDNNRNDLEIRSKFTPHSLPINMNWKDMRFGMVVCHQSFIASKKLMENYDIRYKYSSDLNWMINILKKTVKIKNTDLIISKYLIGGISEKKLLQTLKERYLILNNHFGYLSNFIAHIKILTRYFSKKHLIN